MVFQQSLVCVWAVLLSSAVSFPSYPNWPYYPAGNTKGATQNSNNVPVKVTGASSGSHEAKPALAGFGMGMGMPPAFYGMSGDSPEMTDQEGSGLPDLSSLGLPPMPGVGQPMDIMSLMGQLQGQMGQAGQPGGAEMGALFPMFGPPSGQHALAEKEPDPETLLLRHLQANISSIEMELMQLDMRFEDSQLDDADRRLRQEVALIEQQASKLTKKSAQEHIKSRISELRNVLTRVERKAMMEDQDSAYIVTARFINVDKSDLSVQLIGQRLHMKVKSEEAAEKKQTAHEEHKGPTNPFAMMHSAITKAHMSKESFVDLPFDIDRSALTSTLKNGHLVVTIPKIKPIEVPVQ